LWAEHLGADADDPDFRDPAAGFSRWQRTAAALDTWHAGGQSGPRPPGQIRRHDPQPVSRLQTLWAAPLYRHLFDPDGRPHQLRHHNEF
jgi:hypothetical protein